ncbi:MAG: UDP-N-acetylmuramoyl-L-alanine--D-glutamate ligase [Gammaproteobacteria bacterium]|nr:UDP-N-acetylmuramoyl-L-alanine--D-glutamate ligase [Gammaproteobacteria bacterium]
MHLILGFGATGASFLRYLRKKNIPSIIMDSRKEPPGLAEFNQIDTKNLFLGRFESSILKKVNTVLVSPGVEFDNEILIKARSLGIKVLTDLEIFIEESDSTKLLVTGTNGKTSVVKMLGHVFSNIYEDEKVTCCGNIGKPVLDTLNEGNSVSVIEVSSFHLEHCESLSSEIGVLLNIDQDHLDRHHSIKNYREIKEKILLGCKIGLTGVHDLEKRKFKNLKIVNFVDLLEPYQEEISLYLEKQWPSHETLNVKAVIAIILAYKFLKNEKSLEKLIMDELALINKCLKCLSSFKRLKHRFEILGLQDGITYINDSKSTNISSLLSALKSSEKLFGPNKTLLLCGGDSKNQDFSKIQSSSLSSIKRVFIFGKDRERMIEQIGNKVDCSLSESLEDSIKKSYSFADKGDVLLLSPACSSTDMFLNYEERGEKFRLLSGFK